MKKQKEKIPLKQRKKGEKGITLIALVITIIVLLILAGVSIATLTGDNGILMRASDAKNKTEISQWEERIETAIIAAEGKHRNTTIDDVIQELIDSDVISDANQVNKETGTITTNEPQYDIEGKLDDYIESKSTEITVANYGDRVNYVSKGDSSLIWRIFYDDDDYVYLISSKEDGSNTVESCYLSQYPGSTKTYSGSADITDSFLQSLNSQWFNIMQDISSETSNAKAIAYLMDQDVWDEYKDEARNASYAIGGPTLELFMNSYNNSEETTNEIEITNCISTGYSQNTSSNWLLETYNNGIYNNGTGSYWYLASPSGDVNAHSYGSSVFSVCENDGYLYIGNTYSSFGLRPIVIIPKSKFQYKIIPEM